MRLERYEQELKKKRDELQANHMATEAFQKAKEQEIATLVEENNKKYNDLLAEKNSSENSLRQQAEQEKNNLESDWSIKLSEAVQSARQEE